MLGKSLGGKKERMEMLLPKVRIGEEEKRGFPQQSRGGLGPAEKDRIPYSLILLSTDLIARAL